MALFDFHLLKLEHALIFQIIDQNLYTSVFSDFKTTNGWNVVCDSDYYPNIELPTKTIYLRSQESSSLEDKYHTQVLMFEDNEGRDKVYVEVRLALKEWAIKANEFRETNGDDINEI